MTQTPTQPVQAGQVPGIPRTAVTHERWMESIGIPIHRGYYIEDLRTIDLGWWEERGCNAAFVQVEGLKGVAETRVTEIGPGETLPPLKVAADELVYVLEGSGFTTVWRGDGPRKTFEWGPRSLFRLPRHYWHQHGNGRGSARVRLMQVNYLPIAMAGSSSPGFFFNNPYEEPGDPAGELYRDAEPVKVGQDDENDPYVWFGNLFPDLAGWTRLSTYQNRGAGGHHIRIQFPNSELSCHMSVFPVGTYKKAHRHGPGVVIVIPEGEGYSIMWKEGGEKVIVPWHEGSLFVPPQRWFHQHFNVGTVPSRYLALHPPLWDILSGGSREQVEERARDQSEYPDEESWIRERFEAEVAARGGKSLMEAEAYRDRGYKWAFKDRYAAPTA